MASTAAQQPRHWAISSFRPLSTRPATPSSGAYYKVLFPSPGGNPRRITASQNSTAAAMFAVPQPDALRFETDSLGYSDYQSGLTYLKRRLPLRHGAPAQASLFLDSLEEISFHNFDKAYHLAMAGTTPGDGTDGLYSKGWPKTQMTAYRGTFSQRSYQVLEDNEVSSADVPELKRFITKFPETDGFHRKVPGYKFAFDSDATKYAEVLPSLPEFHQRWAYTSFAWPITSVGGVMFGSGCAVALGVIARSLGCVNNAIFDPDITLTNNAGSTIAGFPIEELKFDDIKLSAPYYGSDDKLYVDLQFLFTWNPFNWNKFVNSANDPTATDRGYEYVKELDATGAFYSPARRPFRKVDFNKLFKPRGAP